VREREHDDLPVPSSAYLAYRRRRRNLLFLALVIVVVGVAASALLVWALAEGTKPEVDDGSLRRAQRNEVVMYAPRSVDLG